MRTAFLQGKESQNPGLSSWAAAAMILAYAFGIGVFSLPHACAVLGWLHFGVLLLVNLGGWILSASLYMGIYLACPEAKTLPDVAHHVLGGAGQSLATGLQLGFNLLFAASFHLTLAISLSDTLGMVSKFVSWTLVGLTLLILLQARNLDSLAILSVLGAAGIILPCFGMLSYFFMEGFTQSVVTEAASSSSWQRSLTAYMDVIFAYSGQHIWIDVQAQCKGPQTFRVAVAKATVCITFFYIMISFSAYFCLGKDTLDSTYPVTHYVGDNLIQLILNILVMIHCSVGYYVCAHVFVRSFERFYLNSVDRNIAGKHFLFTTVFVGITFTVSFAVPLFTDLLAVSTAVFLVILTYTFPLVLYLRLLKLTRFESWTYTCLAIASMGLLIAGVLSSVLTSLEDLQRKH